MCSCFREMLSVPVWVRGGGEEPAAPDSLGAGMEKEGRAFSRSCYSWATVCLVLAAAGVQRVGLGTNVPSIWWALSAVRNAELTIAEPAEKVPERKHRQEQLR